MIFVGVQWLYATWICFLSGFMIIHLLRRFTTINIERITSFLGIGIVICTVYSQIFSLFDKVGMAANLILILASIVIVFWDKKEILSFIQEWNSRNTKGKKIVIALVILLWCYFSSRGEIHYDTDLYHAQSIRWLEEYGIVPGLANLHNRFAYNSSYFPLAALFSLRWLTGVSIHGMSGYFALLLSFFCIDSVENFKKGTIQVSDFAVFAAFFYLMTKYDEILSPASDYATMCTIFYIVIMWLKLLERQEDEDIYYILLCMAGAYAVSLKLTAGLILILVIKPVKSLIEKKRMMTILLSICAGVLIVLPWLIRNVIISGYLLYPMSSLDLYHVDWKLPAEIVDRDAIEIKAWGKGTIYSGQWIQPLSCWYPNWLKSTLSGIEKILVLGAYGGILVWVGVVLKSLIIKTKEYLDFILVGLALIASFLFWQFSAPLVRYGICYVVLVPTVCFGFLLKNMIQKRRIVRIAVITVFGLFAVSQFLPMGRNIANSIGQPYYVTQKEYGTYQLTAYEKNGFTFYFNESGDQTGYDLFPASPDRAEILFRGESIEKGFVYDCTETR